MAAMMASGFYIAVAARIAAVIWIAEYGAYINAPGVMRSWGKV
jgi:hypothetical protein